ncbi:MAG: hypothetical protein R3A45_11510 [Bdellovibrionota bacterium]
MKDPFVLNNISYDEVTVLEGIHPCRRVDELSDDDERPICKAYYVLAKSGEPHDMQDESAKPGNRMVDEKIKIPRSKTNKMLLEGRSFRLKQSDLIITTFFNGFTNGVDNGNLLQDHMWSLSLNGEIIEDGEAIEEEWTGPRNWFPYLNEKHEIKWTGGMEKPDTKKPIEPNTYPIQPRSENSVDTLNRN